MLNWFAEDYDDFVETCEKNLARVKRKIKEDKEIGFQPPAGVRDWSAEILKLAEHQLIMAKFMAGQAGTY
jgi:hypothetical protein